MKKLITITFLSIFTLTHAQVPSYVPTNGLVGWWPFNGNANDESGNGNNGTVNGATLTADRNGVANCAYSFDGVNDKIVVAAQTSIPQQSDYTVSLWFNSPVSTYNGAFISCSTWFCKLGHDNPGLFYKDEIGNITNTWYEQAHFGVEPTVNAWNNLILKKTTNSVVLILNNSVIGSMTTYGFSNFNPTSLIQFGYYCCQNYYQGSLDDIGIWNRALTEAEILALYEGCQLAITTQPQDQNVTTSVGVANFSVASSASNPTYQWQTNLGLGFQNISNAGQYTGATSSSLSVSNLSMSNNNQVFRCIVNDGSCVDTTAEASLTIIDDAGIQTNILPSLKLYPNPVQDVLHIDGLAGKEFEFEVLSIDGKLLQKGKSQGEIAVKELRKGNYVLRVGQQQVSFMKQ